MTCNNARASVVDNHYSLTLPEYVQTEKDAVLKEAIEKYNGFVHVEISRVRKPKSLESNNLFHALLTEYYKSGKHSCNSWQELKNLLKYQFGAGFEQTLTLPDGNQYGILKSLSLYTQAEINGLIDGTIADMLIKDVESKKFRQILETIKYEVR